MHIIVRLLSFARKYWLLVALSVTCMLVGVALTIFLPQLQRMVIDQCLERHLYSRLPILSLSIVAAAIVRGLFGFGQVYVTELVAQKTVYDIRNRLFDHIQRLSFTYHDEAETGQLISRATSDVDMLRQFLGMGVLYLVTHSLMLLCVMGVCLFMNWRLTLISMAVMPFIIISVYRFRTQVRPLSMAVQDQMGKLTTAIQQNLIGIRVVKAFAREDYEVDRFSKQANELLERYLKVADVSAKYQPFLDFLTFTGMVLILWYGGMLVISHQLTIGALVAFYTYLGLLTTPVRILGWVVNIAQYAVVSAERVFEILDTHPEAKLRDGNIDLKKCRGDVEFRDLSFSYANGSRVLHSLNLKVEPGKMVALVGATGSGKSTVINLLPRFYDVTEGSLLIDGVDIRKYRLASLRRQIGIVSQETFLFGDTVRENIAYGKPDSPFEEVVEAAKAANIHDFIMSLPDDYETQLGERGVNLSGGQKQRIAIARALLTNPPILILDDSTSSVDMETEVLIQKALVSLTESRTTFVVAQRVSTIKRADVILVLENGCIVESGTHDQLIAQGERYADIYQLQFGGQENAGDLQSGVTN